MDKAADSAGSTGHILSPRLSTEMSAGLAATPAHPSLGEVLIASIKGAVLTWFSSQKPPNGLALSLGDAQGIPRASPPVAAQCLSSCLKRHSHKGPNSQLNVSDHREASGLFLHLPQVVCLPPKKPIVSLIASNRFMADLVSQCLEQQ